MLLVVACGAGAPATSAPTVIPAPLPTSRVSDGSREGEAVNDAAPAAEPPSASTARTTPQPFDTQADREIGALVTAAIAERKLPGAVVAVGRREGVVFLRAWGRRALDPAPEPMTPDTIFDLASLTKPIVTATSIALLAERGALRLDDPASRYLKEIDRPPTRAITLRQLLTHTAGLPRANPLRDYDEGPERAWAHLFAIDPTTKPGAGYFYDDIGYLWLGEIVARVAGVPLDAFAGENVFAPLSMRETGFGVPEDLRARAAPTEPRRTDGRMIRGQAHDPRAWRLGGVAGHAGLFSTARDLTRFARMLLSEGSLDGARVLAADSVRTLTRAENAGHAVRTPGWDVRSPYSGLRGNRLGGRAYGHGGFTGVSLWLDPERDLFVIFLSNRVHPDGSGNVIRLVGDVTDAAVGALERSEHACAAPVEPVLAGIDVWRARGFTPLAGKRVGLLTHDAARGRDGRRTADVLHDARELTLGALFSPEHGLGSAREGAVGDATDAATGVRVHSLFGPVREPSEAMLADLDALVVDLVDVGTRFFTYASTVRRVLEAAARHGLPVLVLDRPNPLGGREVEGPVLDEGQETFVNYHPLPIRHGMTLGELALFVNAERAIGAEVEVVPVRGWRRELTFDATGLRWHDPSPNLRSPRAALLYPAVGLLEGTNLSVGRGTDAPFEQLGAPWLDATRLVATLRSAGLAGVGFEPTEFTPASGPHARERCRGVRLAVLDEAAFRPVRTGLELARQIAKLHSARFDTERLWKLVGSRELVQRLLGGASVRALEELAAPRLRHFLTTREPYLRYPDCAG